VLCILRSSAGPGPSFMRVVSFVGLSTNGLRHGKAGVG
jgi:hypothetical protein